MKKRNNNAKGKKRKNGVFILVATLIGVLVLSLTVVVVNWFLKAAGVGFDSSAAQGANGETRYPTISMDGDSGEVYQLDNGLTVKHIGSYSGAYMEDGTDESVSNVMMIILENNAGADLQLARIDVKYEGFIAQFEATNIPAGESVVLLERNRHGYVAQTPVSVSARNVVFFHMPMTMESDRLELSGNDGVIQVKNTSGKDISSNIYIYYKNAATDLLYGGITYRVTLKGLAAGETIKVSAVHYDPDTCRLMMVTCGE
jgi:hypothetical protein